MPNRLANETSPYLLQHSHNPVDWYPWGDEALMRAKSEDKPILLSIGYSACHWCHVMAHESFENEAIASQMNQMFINIKVDREERPDIDHIYMEAVQAMTKSGGWPLTIFLTPDLKPFYGGTYFPPEDRHNLPGFPRVLQAISESYHNHRSEIDQTAGQMAEMLAETTKHISNPEDLTEDIIKQAFLILRNQFDPQNGGFGRAPKFPNPLALEFLLRYYSRYKETEALSIVEITLNKMANGGIYDQIGGGFHRYATDIAWQIPHFEKMLYDNALLSRVYLHIYQITRNKTYAEIAEEILDYVLREMTSPQGGFYGTQDADSEGEEGKYYLWTIDEINQVSGAGTGHRLALYFGASSEGNFEGQNILHRTEHQENKDFILKAKTALLKRRENRVKPGRDEKVLASWNGMMLTTLAEAASILDRPDYRTAAIKNGEFMLELKQTSGKIMHMYSNGKGRIDGFLDDYAQVIEGLLALHTLTLEGKWLDAAVRLNESMVNLFSNPNTGLLSDTDGAQKDLIIRPRNEYDGAVPSAASTAALVVQKIGLISGNPEYKAIAGREINSVKTAMVQYPLGYCNWLCSLDFYLSDPKEVAVFGVRNNPQTKDLVKAINSRWIPNKVVIGFDQTDPEAFINSPLLKERAMKDGQSTVYICQNNTCQSPITDLVKLEEALGKH
jgi:uncharacterized protein YyaL (SSP411 family)